MKVRAVALALLVAVAAPAAAQAAPWKRVTAPEGTSIDQVGFARTGDGVLHVVWHHRTGPNTEDLLHTAISSAGKIGATAPIQSGWTGFSNPAVVLDPAGGIRVFWGGYRTTDSSDPQKEINTALSLDGGASWALQPGQVNPDGAQAYASPISATVSGGTIYQAWFGTLGTWVHAGLSPVTPNHDYQAPIGSYGNDPNLASDASGRTLMAWYSNANGHLGVLAQDVAADGSPVGAAATMPGTSDMQVGMLGRTPLVARAGGGFYVAYPTGYPTQNRVRVWRVGASNAPVIAKLAGNAEPVALAAAPDGRLWLVWTDNSSGAPRVLAARSNRGATRFGAAVPAGRAGKAEAAYRLDASSAPGGGLDLLGNFNDGTSSLSATYHRRILPGLALAASPAKLRKGKATDVRFTVRDAGAAVKGARVKAGGKSGTTDGKGRVTLTIKSKKAVGATATRSGYTKAKKRLKVRS
jgi:hypothetical protein